MFSFCNTMYGGTPMDDATANQTIVHQWLNRKPSKLELPSHYRLPCHPIHVRFHSIPDLHFFISVILSGSPNVFTKINSALIVFLWSPYLKDWFLVRCLLQKCLKYLPDGLPAPTFMSSARASLSLNVWWDALLGKLRCPTRRHCIKRNTHEKRQ